ncbi:hypothetical protein GCM10022255_101610 [Dactylosporangium darangshiense]|uniref:Carrier domain-containing protein n=1 Tax=Dactylosporangium darangshiense TaxID=579108 RepID=A0ABP8DS85_9ACTN
MGAVDFGDDVFLNRWGFIVELRTRMQERGIVPEFEIFDLGQLATLRRLLDRHGLPASSTCSRSASGSATVPPLDSCTISPVAARSAATASVSRPRSSVGSAASSRRWTWITLAPTASQSRAVLTNSSSVTGSAGTSDLRDSAPAGATVINVVVITPPILPCRSRTGRGLRRGVDRRRRGAYAQYRIRGRFCFTTASAIIPSS